MMRVTTFDAVVPLATWTRMLDKATKENLHAYRINGDPRFWVVSSYSAPHTAYEVTVLEGTVVCSCRGGNYRPYCKHRALVMHELGRLTSPHRGLANSD